MSSWLGAMVAELFKKDEMALTMLAHGKTTIQIKIRMYNMQKDNYEVDPEKRVWRVY